MTRLLGTKLSDAQKSLDLFTWFFFEKVDEAPSDGGANTSVFRPNGPAFKRLVKLELTLAPDETIHAASLHILRTFIDNPANCMSAADIAKSFVYYGSAAEVGDLANEIFARTMKRSSQPLLMRGTGPSAEGPPSAQYDVFAGESNKCTLGNLTLKNRREVPEPVFIMTLTHAPKPQGWFARLIQRAR